MSLLSNFALDDPIESGGAGIEMHSGLLLNDLMCMATTEMASRKIQKLYYMLVQTCLEVNLQQIRHMFL